MTAAALFSEGWADVASSALPEVIRAASDDLAQMVEHGRVVVKAYNPDFVALCCELAIDLPTRGPVGGVDIRGTEPVALLFHLRDFPNRAPLARSDRKDFPVADLPHLNPTAADQPAWLCLHRGSIDDWFAEHSLGDYVERVQTWFRDAARGRLMREGDSFEHTRLVSPSGYMVFSASAADGRALSRWIDDGGAAGWEYTAIKLSATAGSNVGGWSSSFASQIEWFMSGAPPEKHLSLIGRWNKLAAEMRELGKMGLGVLGWSPHVPKEKYFGVVPQTFGELATFAGRLDVDLRGILAEYVAAGAHKLAGIPVTLGVVRPRPLIGRASNIEWLSFVIVASDDACDEASVPKDEATVLALAHREPLTQSFARDLSGQPLGPVPARAVVGCGALGSKLAMHFGRSGETPAVLVDDAALTPHHLVRHALTARHVGSNKASALREELKELFERGGDPAEVVALEGRANDLVHDQTKLDALTELIDATASQAVLNALVDASSLPARMAVRRCEIADLGRLGLLSIEGEGRNPRLDDLQVHVFDHARRDAAVAAWLARHREETEHLRGPALEEIGLGIGCSSATMRLRDDLVALHAASFASALRSPPAEGGVLLVQASLSGRFSANTQWIDVGSVTVVEAEGAPGWTARVGVRAMRSMQAHLREGRAAERGGILVGLVHRKRQVIYVTDALAPSRDSRGTAQFFVRGVREYPEILREIEERTGGLLGYVGDWHTHPRGPSRPSPQDLTSVRETVAQLRPAGLPAHILILSPEKLVCHVEF